MQRERKFSANPTSNMNPAPQRWMFPQGAAKSKKGGQDGMEMRTEGLTILSGSGLGHGGIFLSTPKYRFVVAGFLKTVS